MEDDIPPELASIAFDDVPPPPDEIAELCAACFRYVTSAVGIAPDFKLETLPLVEHYLAGAREALRDRPEAEDLVARAVGAYFGEVVRRYVRAFWRLPTPDAHDWELCGAEAFLAFNPVGVAWDALYVSSEHGGPSSELRLAREDRDPVDARLGALAVTEEEYFRLGTRLEIVQIAADELRRQMEAGGQADVLFDETDYGEGLVPIGQA